MTIEKSNIVYILILNRSGIAYLCGHLHTLGGLVNSFYTRHTNGLLELELGDWKGNRR
jgi:hypothetical protein